MLELDAWLRQPYQASVERNEMLLKVFFSAPMDAQTVERLFHHAQSQAEEALAVLERIALALRQQLPDAAQRQPYEATIRYGLLAAQAQQQWAQQLRAESASSLASRPLPDPADPAS